MLSAMSASGQRVTYISRPWPVPPALLYLQTGMVSTTARTLFNSQLQYMAADLEAQELSVQVSAEAACCMQSCMRRVCHIRA